MVTATLSRPVLTDELLTPTQLYSRAVLGLVRGSGVHGMAHITGGGLARNLPRAVGPALGIRVDPSTWRQPRIFDDVARAADLSGTEMRATFNCGIGFAVVVERAAADAALTALGGAGIDAWVIGDVRPWMISAAAVT